MTNDATFSYLDLTAVLVVLFVFLLSYHWYKRPGGLPPGPRGVPLLGVIPLVGRHPEEYFARWSREHDQSIITVKMGFKDCVVLNDLQSIHDALIKHGDKMAGRPYVTVVEKVSQGHGLLFVDDGPLYRSQRKFGVTTLRGFGVGRRSMEDRVLEETAYLKDAILSSEGKPFDVMLNLCNAVSNNACSIIMGKRFDYDNEMFREMLTRLANTFNSPIDTALVNMAILIPWLLYVPPFSFSCNKFLKDVKAIISRLNVVVEDHEKSYNENDIRDFIDKFLQEMKRDSDGHFSKLQLRQFLRDLFVAGTETTTNTLMWSLLCLLHYPHYQEKLFEEICDVIGPEGAVSYSSKVRAKMPFTCAFIQEVYRYRTMVPLAVPHKATADVKINGCLIPKNTMVLPNLWAVHNNPDIWTEPNIFQPDRHLDKNGNFQSSEHVVPFCLGPRQCLGEQLGRMEVFVFLVSLVQRFEFSPNPFDDTLPLINDGASGPLFTPERFKIVANPRQ